MGLMARTLDLDLGTFQQVIFLSPLFNFLYDLREVTQISLYQLPVLHLKCHGSKYILIHENHQPWRTCELGLFLSCLSYFVGQWRGCLGFTVTICAHPWAELEPGLQRNTAVWPSSTQVPPRIMEGSEVLSSAWDVLWTHPSLSSWYTNTLVPSSLRCNNLEVCVFHHSSVFL